MSTPVSTRRRQASIGIISTAAILIAGSVVVGDTPAAAAPQQTAYGIDRSITAPSYLDQVVFDEADDLLITASRYSKTMQVITASTGAVVRSLQLPTSVDSLAIDTNSHTVFVVRDAGDRLTAVDYASGGITYSVTTLANPQSIAYDSAQDLLWVANGADDSVSILDPQTGLPARDPIAVGSNPVGLVLDDETGTIYVANSSADSVSVIDATNAVVTRTIPVGDFPSRLAVDPATHTVYVTHQQYTRTVSTIVAGAESAGSILAPYGIEDTPVIVDATSNDLLTASPARRGYLVAFDRDSGAVSYERPVPDYKESFAGPSSGTLYLVENNAKTLTVLTKGRVPTISDSPVLTTVQATVAYRSGPIEIGGDGPVAVTLVGASPSTRRVDVATGEVSGTFPSAGDYTYVVRASNRYGAVARTVAVTVADPPQSAPKLSALVSEDKPLHKEHYYAQIPIGGFPEPKVTAKGLPSGLKLTTNGWLSGTLKKVGKQSFTVTAKNANGTVTRKYTLAVTGLGKRVAYVLFWDREAKLDVLGRRAIRQAVNGMPDNAKVTSVEITGRMYVTKYKSTAERKAKVRAYAIAKYTRHFGVKKHPDYTIDVGRKSETDQFGYSYLVLNYTYK